MREKIVGLLAGHDLLLAVGAPAFTYHVEGSGPHVPAGAALYQLVDDPQTAAWAPAGTSVVASIRLGLLDLLARPAPAARSAPPQRIGAPPAQPPTAGARMSAAFALQTLHAVRDPAHVVVEEAPGSRATMQRHLPITRSDGFYTMASGGLGWGLPAAVGVALARPGERVIALIGDGSSMYSIQALWTAARLRLPMTFVILNNRRYAALQDFAPVFGFAAGEKPQGTDLHGIDFVGLAQAQGCEAVRVGHADALGGVLTEALRSTGPMLVEIEIE